MARVPMLGPCIVVALVLLAGIASFRERLLLAWDVPVQRAAAALHEPELNAVVRIVSQLGGLTFIAAASALLSVVAWRRCRAVVVVLLAATLTRPLVEFALKMLVDRPRPELDRLVEGTGPSFPSGHVMAAVVFWGLLPPIVALLTHNRRVWWASVVVSATAIVGVAGARVYLGVHWTTDVVGGLLVGSLFLIGAERLLARAHVRLACAAVPTVSDRGGARLPLG